MGLASLWEPLYQNFLSELDKVNQGKGIAIPFKYTAKRTFIAFLMFSITYIIYRLELSASHSILVFMLSLVLLCLVIGAYILYVTFLDIKPKHD